jgi:hypothetical protein
MFCAAQVLLPGAPARALAAQAAPLLAAALDGRAAAALALGRSGAGKTWALSGGGDPEQPGALCTGSVGVKPFEPDCTFSRCHVNRQRAAFYVLK